MKKLINEIERLKLMAGLINEVEYNDSVYGVKRTTLTEGKKKKEVKELSIDVANPYEYRMGLQYELELMEDYSNESLEKAKSIVLKNLAKDVNFYTTLLNQDQSPYKFEAPETDKPGMQAKADGFLKKELKKDAKANVKDTLGKKEAGKKKPKGVKVMPDKGVEGKEKVVKEGLEVKQDNDQIEISDKGGDYVGFIENGKVTFSVIVDTEGYADIDDSNWKDVLGPGHAFVKIIDTIGGDVSTEKDYVQITVDSDKLLNTNIKEGLEELKKKVINKYVTVEVEDDGDEYPMLNKKAIADYLKSVIDPSELKSVSNFMNDDEGFDESASYFFEDEYVDTTEKEVEDWAKQEMSYYLFSKPDEFPGKENIEESKTNKYIDLDEDGVEMLNKEAVTNYLKSVIDPEYIDDVDTFMSDDEGWEESSMYFFEVPEDPEATEQDVEEWAKQEISYYLFSKPDEFPHK